MISPKTRVFGLVAILWLTVSILHFMPPASGSEKQAGKAAAAKEGLPPQAAMPAPGPEKGGLASLYPGDEGIERDPRVLFVEDFETGTPEEIGARWGNITKKENVSLTGDLHGDSPGTKSICIANNGSLYTHTKGVDTMYARFYVKFHEKTGYIHHFVALVADRTPTPWPRPGAGEIPPGDAQFSTAIEPTGRWGKFPPPGVWEFYTYWHEMKGRWGSVYDGKQELVQPGRWYCIEAKLKANSSPEKADGEQAFWVDGELYGRFGGFRWRTSDKLKINSFWLNYYTTEQAAINNKDPNPKGRVMQVMISSKKHQDNCRYTVGGLKKGEWTQVEFRAIEARLGWARNGPSL